MRVAPHAKAGCHGLTRQGKPCERRKICAHPARFAVVRSNRGTRRPATQDRLRPRTVARGVSSPRGKWHMAYPPRPPIVGSAGFSRVKTAVRDASPRGCPSRRTDRCVPRHGNIVEGTRYGDNPPNPGSKKRPTSCDADRVGPVAAETSNRSASLHFHAAVGGVGGAYETAFPTGLPLLSTDRADLNMGKYSRSGQVFSLSVGVDRPGSSVRLSITRRTRSAVLTAFIFSIRFAR